MNRAAVLFGVLLVVGGGAMSFLLDQLTLQTFRADRSIWFYTSYAMAAAGVLLTTVGVMIRGGDQIRIEVNRASGMFSRMALVNAAAAGAFAFPLLLPTLEFPILITRWPGVYMVVAYTFFVVVGVIGNVAWSSLLSNLKGSDGLVSLSRWQLWLQLVLTEVAVYTFSGFMFLGGYTGASLDYGGAQATLVGIAMEYTVIPTALSIFGIVVGEMIGVANVSLSLWRRGTAAKLPTAPSGV